MKLLRQTNVGWADQREAHRKVQKPDAVVAAFGGLPAGQPTLRRSTTVDPRRKGITLFEVVIALVIFTVTLPALNTLVQVGTRRAEESAFLARASMECRSKLAEVTVGAEAMETTDWVNFPDMANWSWKVTAVDGDVEGLMQVQVTVKFDPGNNPVQATLSQWVIDPAKRGSTQDRAILKSMDDQNAQPATPSDPETGTTGSGTTGTTGATTPGAGTTGSTGAGATAPSGTTGGGTSGAGATGGRSTGGATGGATGGGTGGGTTGGTTGKGGTK